MFTEEKMHDYAGKLLIGLTDEECQTLLEEFDVIDENMGLISSIPGIDKVEPLSFPYDMTIDELRCDDQTRSITITDALLNCDGYVDREVEVPKVVG